MPSVIVSHPFRPNKRVMVELPDSSDGWTANDTKNAIEMALLAKYGRVAPCVDVPQHQQVKHDQDQAVVKAGKSAHNGLGCCTMQERLATADGYATTWRSVQHMATKHMETTVQRSTLLQHRAGVTEAETPATHSLRQCCCVAPLCM